MADTRTGYFLIADITGYTAYLRDTELEHAQSILTSLLTLLLERTRPPLIVSRTAGDAVVSYAFDQPFVTGQTFVEIIEDTYVAFRRAIELMVLNTTCQCNACRRIETLDLKFFVHHGPFAVQQLDGHDELVGADVVVLHRLLKNRVVEQTGIRAYCLYTDAAAAAMRMGALRTTMVRHTEHDDNLGEIVTWVQDLGPTWERRRADKQIDLDEVGVLFEVQADISLPPEVVWDYLAQVEHRVVLMGSEGLDVTVGDDGRLGEASTFVCYHGNSTTSQTVLEWRPFERIVTRDRPSPLGGRISALIAYVFEPIDGGTRLTQQYGMPQGPPVRRLLMRRMLLRARPAAQQDMDNFKDHIERAHAKALVELR